MSTFRFSDRELRLAAAEVRSAMLDTMPPPSACVHSFSDAFHNGMSALLAKDRRMIARSKTMHRVAAVFLALLVGAAAVLALNPDARAAVVKWAREVFDSSVVYFMDGDIPNTDIPSCEIGWLPEGYEEVDIFQDARFYSALYENKQTGKTILFEFFYIQEGTNIDLFFDESEYIHKVASVNGNYADYYEVIDGSQTNDLIWFDENENVSLHLSGFLSEEEIIRLAENINLFKIKD